MIKLEFNTIVIAASCIVTASSFIINLVVMIKSNKAHFDKIELKLNNVIQIAEIEKQNTQKHINTIDKNINKFSDEIYPRLREVESCTKKHCKTFDDLDKLCELKHKALNIKET